MALTRSFPTQNPAGLPITDTRRVTAGLVVRNTDGTPRPGVFPAHASPLVTGRATAPLMAYDVAPFLAATSRLNTGIELIANDAATTVTTTAAPASNSRIDVIWVRSQFVQHADANNDVVFGVTQGTAALTPVKPAIPAGALELATAEILSTTTQTSTAVITQTHPYTATAGGVVWLRNATEQAAWTPTNGAIAYRLDLGAHLFRRGGVWARSLSRLSARMKRSNVAKSVTNATINQDLSASNLWVEDWRDSGVAAYNNGWTLPATGDWLIEAGGQFSDTVDLYFSVNKSALASFADVSGYAQGFKSAAAVALPQLSKVIRGNAGDVIRLFGAALPASVAWDNTYPNQSWFGIRFLED
jgi:hypothetical protein